MIEKNADVVDQSALNVSIVLETGLKALSDARARDLDRPPSGATNCVECECCIRERVKLIHWANKCAACTTEFLEMERRRK